MGNEKGKTAEGFVGDAVCGFIIVVLCLFLGLGRYRNGIGLGDEGFLAYGAVCVLEGQMPNRDFVSYQPPLSFYTVAMMFKLFGTSLVSMRAFGLCIYIIIPLLVYALSRCLSSRVMALAAAVPATVLGLPFFDFVPFAVWQGVAATLITALFIIQAGATSRCRWAFLAGLATALVILLRHDQGFYLSVAVLVYALALRFAKSNTISKPHPGRIVGLWAAGVMTMLIPLGIYWLICGSVPYMFDQLIVFLLTTYAKTSSLPMPVFRLDQPLMDNLITGLFYLPPVVVGLTAVWLLLRCVSRRFCVKDARLGFILVLSMLFYCQVLTRSDVYHLLITLAPFLVLCAWWLKAASSAVAVIIERWYGRNRDSLSVYSASVGAVLIVVGLVSVFFLSYTKPVFLKSPDESTTILLNRAGVRATSQTAGLVENITSTIQKYAAPDRSILCLPYHPMFYFLSGRHNPTRWNYLWPGDQSEEDHQALIKQVRNDPPAIVVIFEKSSMEPHAPAIFDYLYAEYKIERDLGWVTFYLPLAYEKQKSIY